MKKQTIRDLDLKGKKVFIRVDFNVPLDENQNITDDNRIQMALPTIKYVLEQKAIPILASHLGRPKNGPDPKLSLKPVAKRLQELLPDYTVNFIDDCIGEKVKNKVKELKEGELLLLENVRFYYKEETKNNEEFAKELSEIGAEIYVNDAFGTAHRAHASTAGMVKFFPEDKRAIGFLMEKEVEYLGKAVYNPERPYIAILGGAKISGKIDVINNLGKLVDKLIIGGGMVFTFYKAMGYEVGKSLLEEDKIDLAKELLEKYKDKLILPEDIVVAAEFKNEAESKIVDADKIPADMMGLDIGPKSIEKFKNILKDAKMVVWNGPLGVFEFENFAKGTFEIAKLLADLKGKAITIVGGGDSAAAVKKAGLKEHFTHVSTGGGASLEFLEGKSLPALELIPDKK